MVGAKGFDLGSMKSRFEEARSDPELDLGHTKDWRRVAIVADANFVLRRSFPVFARVIPVETKLFESRRRSRSPHLAHRVDGPKTQDSQVFGPSSRTPATRAMLRVIRDVGAR